LDHPHIKDLNLTIKRGQVIAVVGDIGSGKALLASIMGQLKQSKGIVKSNGSTCGFIPHEPWFINATVRDNIVFGLEYDEKKYSDAIRISGLTRDIMLLSNKDESFVNDLNLSMPQKQRLSLARTIYQDPDIILMEDCLGDFDQGQAKQLFKESICNQLKPKKSIIMLTQQKLFLAKCDLIIVMQAGKIIERGSYDEMKLRDVNFSGWVTDVIHIEDDPNGLFENVTEIRLDPITSMTPKSESPLSFSPRPPSRKTTRRSPLAVQKPINAETTPGIQQIIDLNSQSVQNTQLTEHNITKMIERGQNSIISGTLQRPPANFANQDILSRAIELNNLTVHSIHDFDIKTLDILEEKTFHLKPGTSTLAFLLLLFTLAHGFRFLSDIWLTFIVDQKEQEDLDRNYLIFVCLSMAIILSILLRGFGLLQVIISKSAVWHRNILEVFWFN
jgi:ABC-type lipoprotein export system ATPase subunit